MKILVVDDERDTRALLKDLLTQAGHHVTEAPGAAEAMMRVEVTRFDLVLLDWMMPGMDGGQFAQFMSTHWDTFETPIIVVSCRRDPETKSWARLNNAVRYVEKPFSTTEILEAVREVEQRHEAGG